jgi:hypothetical protein
MRTRILTTIGLGLALAACQGPYAKKDPSVAALSASATCASYGLPIGSKTYNACVAYQDSRPPGPSVPPYRLDLYNNRVDADGYRVDGAGHRMAVQNLY